MKQLINIFALSIFLLLLVPFQSEAQIMGSVNADTVRVDNLTDQQINQIWNRAQQENMSIDEVVNLARTQGLPPAEASKLRIRLNRARAGGGTTVQPPMTSTEIDTIRIDDEVEIVVPDTLLRFEEITPEVVDTTEHTREIYGHSIFTDQSLEVFTTTDAARAPDSYVLGSEDQIRITIFGASQADLLLEISPEGYVQPTGMPRIFLKGLTIREARQVLRERLTPFYTFKQEEFALTIKVARTININIFGEVRARGGFNVSALNSAFNALTAAGGPTEIGSVRRIELIRSNERKIIDVYEFMSNPSVKHQFDLRHNDIIFVPVAEKIVEMRGAVKRPMRYEVTGNDGLYELIRYAGGINYDTAPNFVQVQRIVNGEPVLLEWSLSNILENREHVRLMDGDIVKVREIGRDLERFVKIEGSVFYPGRYNLDQSPTLLSLLERAEIRPQAKTDLVFIERIQDDETVRIIPVELDVLIEESRDMALHRRDNVVVYDLERYRNVASLRVTGNVRNPVERSLRFDERISIANALQLAGGLRPTAAETAFIFRRNLFNTDIVEHIRVNLVQDAGFELRPGDELRIYNQSSYSDIGEISVRGAVNENVDAKFDANLTVTDLLTMAGGFTRGAQLSRVDVFRLDISFSKGTTYDIITLSADSTMNVVNAPEGFRLQPFDRIVVRRIPEFNIGASIDLNGEVRYPGNYPLISRRTRISDIIKEAGGLIPKADPRNAVIMRSFNNVGPIAVNLRRALRNSGSNKYDPIIFDDDVIMVPKENNTVTILVNATRIGELQEFGVVDPDPTIRSFNRVNVVYQGSRSAGWYIRNFAGGFAEEADRWSVTVTKPNGEIAGTGRSLLFFKNYPRVEPGSTIALRLDPPDPPSDRPPVDWDQIQTRTLQTLTTLLTLLVLINQL
jgi:protein involved in polysaccharide export with SLBB domain